MKTFIYTYTEKVRKNDVLKAVEVFRVIKNKPVLLIRMSETFVSEFQLVWLALKEAKALPRRAFEQHQNGSPKYGAAWLMKEAGIADVIRI